MSRALLIEAAGPAVSLQDFGRNGQLALGLSPGGAMDPIALHEAAALLGEPIGPAVVEMGGTGARMRLTAPARIALSGAPMAAAADGAPLAWHAVHGLPADTVIEIGPCRAGQWGYLAVGGGIATPEVMGGRAWHGRAGLGRPLAAGDRLPLGPDPAPERSGLCLPPPDRFSGGVLRVLPSAHTAQFPPETLARFCATRFRRGPRGGRLGAALDAENADLNLPEGLSLVSEVTLAGDVQITGDGTPFILMADCQSTGGYPRIAAILPMDMPRAAQAPPGTRLGFAFTDPAQALDLHRRWLSDLAALPQRCEPLLRAPGARDLLGAQLVSGVTDGHDPA